jgi:predicted O-methyltransferase YrrM
MLRFDQEIIDYICKYTSPEDEVLNELYRETHLKVLHPHMLAGHLQGRILEMISRMIRPENILEIGTYTGYSSICLAKGLSGGGKLHTIERNDELHDIARKYFKKAGLENKIIQYTGEAREIIPGLDFSFELVFIDSDKDEYLDIYSQVFDKVPPGGYILADNVLWEGKVTGKPGKGDTETRSIIEFNDLIKNDNRVENLILAVRDGLMIIRKI